MDNIFTTLTNNLPKPAQQEASSTAQSIPPIAKAPVNSLIADWQKTQKPELTDELLRRMKPTISAAMSSYAPGMERQLAVKAANLTLDALKTFDPSKGASPNTHVFHTLKRLSRYGIEASNIIPQSEGVIADRKKLEEASNRFIDLHDREPSLAELADATGFSKKKIDKLMSVNSVINESATLAEDSQKDTFASSDLTDKDYFDYVYASVGPIDQKIMDWTSGLGAGKQLSNNDIAKKLNMTAAAVSQRKAKIQKMLSDIRGLL